MLSNVRRFIIHQSTLDAARSYLRPPGQRGHEAFVVFAGVASGVEAQVHTVIFPPQSPFRGPDGGVGVHVSGQTLFDLNRWAVQNRKLLLGQMHTHPGEAFHSETDDAFPLVSLPGAFSVVVPYFARSPIKLSACACYRSLDRRWRLVSAENLFLVV